MNPLYPIFLKPKNVNFLIIGGGFVAAEKLGFLIKSSPESMVKVVGTEFRPILLELKGDNNVIFIERPFEESDLIGNDIIIAATNNRETNIWIRELAKKHGKLINVADTPDLCDFYLGGIVNKGNLKIAISTNGKSPTLAKRIRQLLEDVLPEEIDDLAENLHEYRKTLKMDFEGKVAHLNELTKNMVDDKKSNIY